MVKTKRSLSKILFSGGKKFISTTLIIFSIISICLFVLSISAAIYAYNFVPIKTINLCVSNETHELPIDIECFVDEDCSNEVKNALTSEEFKTEIKKEIGDNELADISIEIASNFATKVSEEALICINNECRGIGVKDIGQLLNPNEGECLPSEENKEIKVFVKDIVPPGKIFTLLKSALKSKDFRNQIEEFIKTGEFSEN